MKFRVVAGMVSAVWLAGAVAQTGAQQKTV